MDSPSPASRSWWRILLNRRTVISLVLLVAVVVLISSNAFWRWMYPIGYQSDIQQAAQISQANPLLVASVIRVESKFQSTDVSHAGAIGLMQLMPGTAQWVAQQMQTQGLPYSTSVVKGQTVDLSVPAVNIRLGAWYIHYLVQQFNGNEVAAVAAYNAGLTRVRYWLAHGRWDGQLATITDIPVGETRHFVDRVFYNYQLYQRIYGREPGWQQAR